MLEVPKMMKLCPKCGCLSFFNSYFQKWMCNTCEHMWKEEAVKVSELKYPKCHDCAIIDCGERSKHYPKCYIKVSDAPRLVVKDFAIEMERQLRANDHKGGWENSTNYWLIEGLRRNVTALRACVNHESRGLAQQEEILRRTANIANFAMMVSDNARRLPETHTKGPLSSPEIVNAHQNGTLCEQCGVYLGTAVGKARLCVGCED